MRRAVASLPLKPFSLGACQKTGSIRNGVGRRKVKTIAKPSKVEPSNFNSPFFFAGLLCVLDGGNVNFVNFVNMLMKKSCCFDSLFLLVWNCDLHLTKNI